jgi:hypothetical protein
MPREHPPLSRIHVARNEISTPMGLRAFQVKVQTGLQLITIRRIPVGKKTRNHYQVIGEEARRQNG